MSTAIVWLRNELRVLDNPALLYATREAERVIPVYIHAPQEDGAFPAGGASRWWLHHSLSALDEHLRTLGSRLVLRRGPTGVALEKIVRESGADAIYWNRLYEPARRQRDRTLTNRLRGQGLTCRSFNGSLLHEPWTVQTGDGRSFRVFTPFWAAHRRLAMTAPLSAPDPLPAVDPAIGSEPLTRLGLLPRIAWHGGLDASWRPGEGGALQRLADFLDDSLADYAEGRERPAANRCSRLSPHLHFGEVSPRTVVQAVQERMDTVAEAGIVRGGEAFLRELGWREFAYHLLYHHPGTAERPLDERFERYPWRERYAPDLIAWQRGQTGFPLVDAGMRELWHSGTMHNRVRMVVASLLTKNLRIPWQQGAAWFWDTLVDADLANNTLGWQWTAGCGADAAPYFRIFNPILQGERFDPQGHYVRRWVPELARLPAGIIHRPWQGRQTELHAAGVQLGKNYPAPIVDLKVSRQQALDGYQRVKRASVARTDR